MAGLGVRLFGKIRVSSGENSIDELSHGKIPELFSYLLLHRGIESIHAKQLPPFCGPKAPRFNPKSICGKPSGSYKRHSTSTTSPATRGF